ncbi:hypothetical protein WJX81_007417 [Elliptochloris bilobata]|uniref:NTF2 domain-containing protein n=1 Tax=Elliptochloris bilobata TaxID=381761 RepID=A0AAW1RFP2_9CHLO
MADPEAVAKAFSDHYYNTFDSNRAALGSLYQETSILTFEGNKVQGAGAILQKLTSLPFQACQHKISSIDAQPSISGGLIVFVTGQLLPEGEANALKFSQIFHLAPVGNSFVITNDLFRLNYA